MTLHQDAGRGSLYRGLSVVGFHLVQNLSLELYSAHQDSMVTIVKDQYIELDARGQQKLRLKDMEGIYPVCEAQLRIRVGETSG